MKTKLVLWGENAQNERVLLALQLHTDTNKVSVWHFPESVATPEFTQLMLDEWRNDKEVAFPEGTTPVERDLSVTESILPDDLKAEKPDAITRAQTEWHFIVLSSKMHDALKSELAGLGDKINSMEKYSYELWDNLKNYWNKVQDNVRDKNLFREHADELRVTSNALFDKLKAARTVVSQEFEQNSKKWYDNFNAKLNDIEKLINEGMNARFPQIFDQLRDTQNQFRDQKMTKDHGNEVWARIDNLFKAFKEKKYGPQSAGSSQQSNGNQRQNGGGGLEDAVSKMKASIDRDKKDLEYEQRRADNSANQLEEQLRMARINIIKDRINSKTVKYDDMLKTKQEADARLAAKKAKDDAAKAKAEADKVKAEEMKAAQQTATPAPAITEEHKETSKSETDSTKAEAHHEASKSETDSTKAEAHHEAPQPETGSTKAEAHHEAPQSETGSKTAEAHHDTPIVPEHEVKVKSNIMAEHDTTRLAEADLPAQSKEGAPHNDHVHSLNEEDAKEA